MSYDRDRLLLATDLAALCDELLGPRRGRGPSATWPCPNRGHAQTGTSPPLHVYPGRRGFERWHCHGCGAGGTAVDLVVTTHGLPVRDALAYLAQRAGIAESDRDWTPPARHLRAVREEPAVLADPEGLARYVESCSERLWTPQGSVVRHWLTGYRGIPQDVLAVNRIGADAGIHRQPRPEGVPRVFSRAVVFPVLEAGAPVFVQLRLLHPGPRGLRYLNPSAALGPNPKVALFEPVERVGECVVVTEGPTDGLSAAAAGYRAAAVLGTGTARSAEVTRRLAALAAPLVVAFDANAAGREGAAGLFAELRRRGDVALSRLDVPAPHDDLNDWMRASTCWPGALQTAVRDAVNRPAPAVELVPGPC